MTLRSKRAPRRALLCLALVATAACGSDGPGITEPEVPNPNLVRLVSDPGDYIGGGNTYEYTQANAVMTVTAEGGHVRVRISGDQSWFADFQLPVPAGAATLQPGTYNGLQRYPFNTETGGISWSGEGRGCNTITGSATVDSVRYTSAGALAALGMRFEQHCEGAAPALRGTIRWRADDPTTPPGPVDPAPSTLWQPSAGALPGTGNAVYLRSDAGDYIGAGQTYTYTAPTAPITVTADGGHVSVSVGGWRGDFLAMNGVTQLRPGYYADLQRYPFHNPVKGGLRWYGNGRGCNALTGWFVVDHVAYAGTTLTALDLRFEQHCEGMTPALRGAVRWRA